MSHIQLLANRLRRIHHPTTNAHPMMTAEQSKRDSNGWMASVRKMIPTTTVRMANNTASTAKKGLSKMSASMVSETIRTMAYIRVVRVPANSPPRMLACITGSCSICIGCPSPAASIVDTRVGRKTPATIRPLTCCSKYAAAPTTLRRGMGNIPVPSCATRARLAVSSASPQTQGEACSGSSCSGAALNQSIIPKTVSAQSGETARPVSCPKPSPRACARPSMSTDSGGSAAEGAAAMDTLTPTVTSVISTHGTGLGRSCVK